MAVVSAFRTPGTVVRASISGAQEDQGDAEKLVPTAVGYLFDRLISKYKSWPLRLYYILLHGRYRAVVHVPRTRRRRRRVKVIQDTFVWKKGGEKKGSDLN